MRKTFLARNLVPPHLCHAFQKQCLGALSQSLLTKNVYFFCDKAPFFQNPLHKVATDKAGENLRRAIGISNNDALRVKLSSAINPTDAHAIDIQYHLKCWGTHVSHILRKSDVAKDSSTCNVLEEIASEIEFTSLLEELLMEGQILSVSSLQEMYINIRSDNNVSDPDYSKKSLKKLIETKIDGVEFHQPSKRNESERVSIKQARDAAMELAENIATKSQTEMKTIFKAALTLRKAIAKCEKWNFTGSLNDADDRHIPSELYCFFRWVLQGANASSSEGKNSTVNQNAKKLAQTTVYLSLSNRQTSHSSSNMRFCNEMPQQLAVGITMRQTMRSKKLINMLHGCGASVDYTRLLKLETQIANTILERMVVNDGIYIPRSMVNGEHIFFAIDNSDFAEDTPDGKNTLHGTTVSVYQQCKGKVQLPPLALTGLAHDKSLTELPSTFSTLLPCKMPKNPKPPNPKHPLFGVNLQMSLVDVMQHDSTWLLGKAIMRNVINERGVSQDNKVMHIPSWAGYNSLITEHADELPLTRVETLPMIAAPAHEWSTLLTVLKLSQNITTQVLGQNHKTVITLDMGLYKPAKQLQMSRKDLNDIILRPGELHTVMAHQRSIGRYIEASGIDSVWTESEIFTSVTAKQILDGRHVKRAVHAHMITFQALLQLYTEAFFSKYPGVESQFREAAQKLNDACGRADIQAIKSAHDILSSLIEKEQIFQKMHQFHEQTSTKPLNQGW